MGGSDGVDEDLVNIVHFLRFLQMFFFSLVNLHQQMHSLIHIPLPPRGFIPYLYFVILN